MRKPHSTATKAKISASLKGKKKSMSTRGAIAAARTGTPHSEETKAKIAESLRKK